MHKDFPDNRRVFDEADDAHGAFTSFGGLRTGFGQTKGSISYIFWISLAQFFLNAFEFSCVSRTQEMTSSVPFAGNVSTSRREERSDAEPSTISPPRAANRESQGKQDGGASDRSPGRKTEDP